MGLFAYLGGFSLGSMAYSAQQIGICTILELNTNCHVLTPILDRYGVLPQDRPYIMAFYIRGLMAIISEWLKNDCADSITYVTGVIQQCVKIPQSETMNDV